MEARAGPRIWVVSLLSEVRRPIIGGECVKDSGEPATSESNEEIPLKNVPSLSTGVLAGISNRSPNPEPVKGYCEDECSCVCEEL
jgi:hypothetical protein